MRHGRGPWEWGTFTPGFADALAGRLAGLRVLEVYAGNGRLALMLAARGVDVLATSLFRGHDGHARGMHQPVVGMTALDAVRGYGPARDVLLMSWPPVDRDSAAESALEWGSGRPILYIGEVTDLARGVLGGCATDAFSEVIRWVGPLAAYEPRSPIERSLELRVDPDTPHGGSPRPGPTAPGRGHLSMEREGRRPALAADDLDVRPQDPGHLVWTQPRP